MSHVQTTIGTEVIDFGAHFHTELFEPLEPLHKEIGPISEDHEQYAAWFKRGGFDAAVLSQPYFMGHDDADRTAQANDALLDIIDAYEEYYSLAAIPIGAGGDEAAAEFERSLDNGYNGGALPTKVNGDELVAQVYEPIFEIADSTGAPVMVHPKLHESVHPEVLDDTYLLNAIFGREVALCESISKVVHEGVLDRYPNLNLVYHHLGGNIATMMGRSNIQLDIGRWPGRQQHIKDFEEFREQIENRIYLDTSGHLGYLGPLRDALEVFPSSQLLVATDAPYEPRSTTELERYVTSVKELTSRRDARRILGGNAQELMINL